MFDPAPVNGVEILYFISRQVASLRACLTLMIYWTVVEGNVRDNTVSSYRLHAPETQQLTDATSICYLCGVARRHQ